MRQTAWRAPLQTDTAWFTVFGEFQGIFLSCVCLQMDFDPVYVCLFSSQLEPSDHKQTMPCQTTSDTLFVGDTVLPPCTYFHRDLWCLGMQRSPINKHCFLFSGWVINTFAQKPLTTLCVTSVHTRNHNLSFCALALDLRQVELVLTYFDSSDWPMIHELHWSSTVADVLHLHHELCVLGERFVTVNWRGPLNDTEPDLWLLISCRVILWLSVMSRQRYLWVPAFKSLKSADCFVWSLQTFCTWIRWLGFTKFCEIEQQLQKPLTLQRRAEAASVVVLQHITVH